MWTALLSLVLGAVPAIVRELSQARVDLANAETEKEKVAVQERIKGLEAQRDVMVSRAASPWDNIARFLLLSPVALYWFWTMAYDKIMCKWFTASELVDRVCTTDKLEPWQMNGFYIILTFYFGGFLIDKFKR